MTEYKWCPEAKTARVKLKNRRIRVSKGVKGGVDISIRRLLQKPPRPTVVRSVVPVGCHGFGLHTVTDACNCLAPVL